jgi:hypothetical protein
VSGVCVNRWVWLGFVVLDRGVGREGASGGLVVVVVVGELAWCLVGWLLAVDDESAQCLIGLAEFGGV